jgi:hypothetical protein
LNLNYLVEMVLRCSIFKNISCMPTVTKDMKKHSNSHNYVICRSRVIGLDMRENRIFTLCRMINWVVLLGMFWNFISSLPVKRGGSLSFLVGTISNVLVMEIGWTDVGSGGYILASCAHSNTSFPLKWIKIWLYIVVP